MATMEMASPSPALAVQNTETTPPNIFASDNYFNQSKFNINHLHSQLFLDDASAKFWCNICKKSFYNAVALKNHNNMQHDASDESTTEGEQFSSSSLKNDQQTSPGGFVFIPCARDASETEHRDAQGTCRRLYAADTSYVLVQTRAPDETIDAFKRRRLEGLVRRTRMKPRKPVDLRGPFTCTYPSPTLQCGQIFFNCCEYSLHYRVDHTKRRKANLRCQVCEKRLDRGPPIVTPTLTPILPGLSCRPCARTFLESSDLDEHNRVAHAKQKPHQCSICAKRFSQQGGLQQHIRMHTGIRPFGCQFCPKAFTQKAGLDQHLRTHTKVKPFSCVVCSKSFSQSVHLRQHMRTHTNIQPFACDVCGRRFKQSSHLKFHRRSHGSATFLSLPSPYTYLHDFMQDQFDTSPNRTHYSQNTFVTNDTPFENAFL